MNWLWITNEFSCLKNWGALHLCKMKSFSIFLQFRDKSNYQFLPLKKQSNWTQFPPNLQQNNMCIKLIQGNNMNEWFTMQWLNPLQQVDTNNFKIRIFHEVPTTWTQSSKYHLGNIIQNLKANGNHIINGVSVICKANKWANFDF